MSLLLSEDVHWDAKTLLKWFVFNSESEIRLSLIKRGRMFGTFSPL